MHDSPSDSAVMQERQTERGLLDVQRDLLAVARRSSRSKDEAADLVQDVLAFAVMHGGRDWSSAVHRAWLRGVTRKMAAFRARTAGRRRRREAMVALLPAADNPPNAWAWEPGFLAQLPRSLRLVAVLMAADLGAAEIRWILDLTDTALRQRLSALRKVIRATGEDPRTSAPAPRYASPPVRAEILASIRQRRDVAIATHDPDNHPLILCVRVAHERGPGGNSMGKEFSCPTQS